MKKINKSHIFSFILGVIISGGITGVLAYKLAANQVGYTPSDSTWQVSDVDNALDSLFDMATYGDATSSDIKSGKTALVNGEQVTGNLTVPNYTTLANTENVGAGSSSSARTGYYYLDNYKVTCGTTTCPSYTSLTGTASISPGGTKSFTNGYYNMSNYKVSCSSCPSCPSCNSCCSGYNAPRTVLNRTYSGTANVENLGYKPTLIILKMNKGSSYDTTTYFESIDSSTVWASGSKRTIGASNCWLQAISSTGFTWRTTSGSSYSGASVTFYIW